MDLTWLVTWALLGLLGLCVLVVGCALLRIKKQSRTLDADIVGMDRELIKIEKLVKSNNVLIAQLQRSVVDLQGRTNPQMPVVKPAVPATTPFDQVGGRHSRTARPRSPYAR